MSNTNKKKKCLVVDGNNVAYRSYYASKKINWMEESKEIYIFLKILMSVLNRDNYEKVFVTFDEGKETFRRKKQENYKEKRKEIPEEIFETMKNIRELVDLMKIEQKSDKEFEADDLIASFVENFQKKEDFEFHILSQDKDLSQLISKNVKILKYKNGTLEEFGEKEFFEENGFTSEYFTYYLSLTGDKIDNVKGINGIGEKRAKWIASNFGSIENTFSNINLLPKEIKVIIENKEKEVRENFEMIKLIKNLKLKNWESYNFLKAELARNKKFIEFCENKKMNSIIRYMNNW